MRVQVSYLGRVQGVGFRATARAIAAGYRVTGWVRNEPDGSVVLQAQGEDGEVRAFLGAIRGEMGELIQHMDEVPVSDERGESGFMIRRA